MEKNRFSKLLINWYNKNKRALPWRESQEPYRIWLSEVLLQQTRVAQGMPYYFRFLEAFPDIKALAMASEKDVLRLWQGLGYYSRARNLHSTAKTIVSDHKSLFPANYEGLLKLKGVGKYTAAAIASFAYNENVAVVDGNVYRVLARVYGISENIASPAGQKAFQLLANELLPKKDSSTHNQAIMEFGALQCTPRNPNCEECPLAFMCYAYSNKKQTELPVKIKNTAKTTRHFHYLLVKDKNNYLMQERKGKDIWKGLYEFPMVEDSSFIEIGTLLKRNYKLTNSQVHIISESKIFKHILSHQNLYVKFWILESPKMAEALKKQGNFKFFSISAIHDLPKPVLINKFLEESIF